MSIRYRHAQLGQLALAIGLPAMLVGATLAFRDSFAGGLTVSVLAAFIPLSLWSPIMTYKCGLGLG